MWRASRVALVNSVPNDKLLNRSKLKAIAHDKVYTCISQISNFAFKWVETNVGKVENSSYQQCFQTPLSMEIIKKPPDHVVKRQCDVNQGQILLSDFLTVLYVKVPIAANYRVFVYKIQVNPIHTILKYGDYYDFMDR